MTEIAALIEQMGLVPALLVMSIAANGWLLRTLLQAKDSHATKTEELLRESFAATDALDKALSYIRNRGQP